MAAVLLVLLFSNRPGADGGPAPARIAWELLDAAQLEPAAFDAAAWLAAVNAGQSVDQGAESPLTLALAEGLVVRAMPEARFSAPVLERLPRGAPIRLRLHQGELIVRTVASYAGRPIEIVSADAAVRITGTAVSVMTGAPGTCVCVAHGTVLARQLATKRQEAVGPGETWFSFVEQNDYFGRCYHEAFGHQPGVLGPEEYAAEHLEPLMKLEAESLFD